MRLILLILLTITVLTTGCVGVVSEPCVPVYYNRVIVVPEYRPVFVYPYPHYHNHNWR